MTEDPAAYRNKYVEVQGRVRNYEEPKGDELRTWGFEVVDRDGSAVRVYTDGRAAEDIAEADRLVRAARDNDEPVYVIGYLRTGRYKSVSGGPRLDLREVQYREDLVRLGRRRERDDHPNVQFGVGYGHYSSHLGHYRGHYGHGFGHYGPGYYGHHGHYYH